MSFDASIDFSKYGINFNCAPETEKLPELIKENIIPVIATPTTLKFDIKGGASITMNLGKKLGAGTYGAVYTTDTEIDKGTEMIVKIIKSPDLTRSELSNFEYDIIQEAIIQIIIYEATKKIAMPEINLIGPFAPKLYLIGKNQENFYIVSERLDGTLHSFLNGNTQIASTDFIKTSICQIAKILETLYSAVEFNHRDLKTDNIMYKLIDGKINVRLIDFGFSCLKYRKLVLSSISKGVFASHLHCNSKIRDMHSFLFYLVYYSNYARLSCPLKRVINALIVNDINQPSSWGETYNAFNVRNSIGNKNVAENCSFEVVYNIFSTLEFGDADSCSKINSDWTKYLVKLYLSTRLLLTDSEYANVRKEPATEFLLLYLKSRIIIFWRRNKSKNMLVTEFPYTFIDNPQLCNYAVCPVQLAPTFMIPELFDEFMKSRVVLESDTQNESILHKIVRNKDFADADSYLDRAMALMKTREHINYISADGETAYTLAFKHKYKYAINKLEPFIDIDKINLNLLRVILDPECRLLDNGDIETSKSVLLAIITLTKSHDADLIEPFLLRTNKATLEKMVFNTYSFDNYLLMNIAVFYNNVNVIKALLKYDLPVNKLVFLFDIANVIDKETINMLLDKYLDVSLINNFYNKKNSLIVPKTPLMHAVGSNNYFLVEAFSKIPELLYSTRNADGKTCLYYARISRKDTERAIAFKIVKLLLDKYPALSNVRDRTGFGAGNPTFNTDETIRKYIKNRKSTMFRKNPNTEKNKRRGGKSRTRTRARTRTRTRKLELKKLY